MGAFILCWCLALIIIPNLDAKNVRWVPADTNTVITDDATHEISRFIPLKVRLPNEQEILNSASISNIADHLININVARKSSRESAYSGNRKGNLRVRGPNEQEILNNAAISDIADHLINTNVARQSSRESAYSRNRKGNLRVRGPNEQEILNNAAISDIADHLINTNVARESAYSGNRKGNLPVRGPNEQEILNNAAISNIADNLINTNVARKSSRESAYSGNRKGNLRVRGPNEQEILNNAAISDIADHLINTNVARESAYSGNRKGNLRVRGPNEQEILNNAAISNIADHLINTNVARKSAYSGNRKGNLRVRGPNEQEILNNAAISNIADHLINTNVARKSAYSGNRKGNLRVRGPNEQEILNNAAISNIADHLINTNVARKSSRESAYSGNRKGNLPVRGPNEQEILNNAAISNIADNLINTNVARKSSRESAYSGNRKGNLRVRGPNEQEILNNAAISNIADHLINTNVARQSSRESAYSRNRKGNLRGPNEQEILNNLAISDIADHLINTNVIINMLRTMRAKQNNVGDGNDRNIFNQDLSHTTNTNGKDTVNYRIYSNLVQNRNIAQNEKQKLYEAYMNRNVHRSADNSIEMNRVNYPELGYDVIEEEDLLTALGINKSFVIPGEKGHFRLLHENDLEENTNKNYNQPKSEATYYSNQWHNSVPGSVITNDGGSVDQTNIENNAQKYNSGSQINSSNYQNNNSTVVGKTSQDINNMENFTGIGNTVDMSHERENIKTFDNRVDFRDTIRTSNNTVRNSVGSESDLAVLPLKTKSDSNILQYPGSNEMDTKLSSKGDMSSSTNMGSQHTVNGNSSFTNQNFGSLSQNTNWNTNSFDNETIATLANVQNTNFGDKVKRYDSDSSLHYTSNGSPNNVSILRDESDVNETKNDSVNLSANNNANNTSLVNNYNEIGNGNQSSIVEINNEQNMGQMIGNVNQQDSCKSCANTHNAVDQTELRDEIYENMHKDTEMTDKQNQNTIESGNIDLEIEIPSEISESNTGTSYGHEKIVDSDNTEIEDLLSVPAEKPNSFDNADGSSQSQYPYTYDTYLNTQYINPYTQHIYSNLLNTNSQLNANSYGQNQIEIIGLNQPKVHPIATFEIDTEFKNNRKLSIIQVIKRRVEYFIAYFRALRIPEYKIANFTNKVKRNLDNYYVLLSQWDTHIQRFVESLNKKIDILATQAIKHRYSYKDANYSPDQFSSIYETSYNTQNIYPNILNTNSQLIAYPNYYQSLFANLFSRDQSQNYASQSNYNNILGHSRIQVVITKARKIVNRLRALRIPEYKIAHFTNQVHKYLYEYFVKQSRWNIYIQRFVSRIITKINILARRIIVKRMYRNRNYSSALSSYAYGASFPSTQNIYPNTQHIYSTSQHVYPKFQHIYAKTQHVHPTSQHSQHIYLNTQH